MSFSLLEQTGNGKYLTLCRWFCTQEKEPSHQTPHLTLGAHGRPLGKDTLSAGG